MRPDLCGIVLQPWVSQVNNNISAPVGSLAVRKEGDIKMKMWAVEISAGLVLAVASAGFGETVNMSLVSSPSVGLSQSLTITAKVGTSTAMLSSAGAYKWNVTSDTGSTFSSNIVNHTPLYTFCIQAFQTTGSSYNVAGLNTATPLGGPDGGAIDALAAAQIQGLVDKYWSALDFGKTKSTNYTFNSVAYTDDQVAAAFQLALWEIEYDGGAGGEKFGATANYFSSGNLKAVRSGTAARQLDGQAAINLANGWLNNFTADVAISSIALVSGTRNDQFFGIPNAFSGASVPTPLPMALPGALALIAGLGLHQKLRRRKN